MSLDFDFTDMMDRLGRKEFDRLTDHPTEAGKWHPVTDTLIWGSMWIDMNEITEASADKFADRILALQAIQGGQILSSEGRITITRQDVKNHIGMRTNVATKPDATFKAKLFRMAIAEGERMARKQDMSAFGCIAASTS